MTTLTNILILAILISPRMQEKGVCEFRAIYELTLKIWELT